MLYVQWSACCDTKGKNIKEKRRFVLETKRRSFVAVIVVAALVALVGMVSLSLRFRSLPKDR